MVRRIAAVERNDDDSDSDSYNVVVVGVVGVDSIDRVLLVEISLKSNDKKVLN